MDRKQSKEHVAKRMASMKKNNGWAKSGERMIKLNKSRTGKPLPDKQKKAISKALKGKRNSLGCKRSLEFRKNLSEYWKDNPNHNHWIDGQGKERTSKRHEDMSRLEYRLWREAVFERDDFTCVCCGQRGGNLNADHIKPYSTHPELRYAIDNGRTLCLECHKITPTFGFNIVNKLIEKNKFLNKEI